VINAHVTAQVAPHGYFYAPDPSSQSVCTIGGNVAENSGGAHCLKYGFTATHVTGREVVLPSQNIKKTLTEEKPTEIALHLPQEKGEVTFTCGMNMLRGAIVVE
jgi:FAD/FMN-containing dehydrogenase